MPAEPTQAKRFGKTRAAQSQALLEDYAELIADLLAAEGEARPTTSLPYRGVFLTPAGDALAHKVRTRHRLVVAVLTAIGVPHEAAEQDAEGIEHHISPATLRAFAAFLKSRE
jgi:DtxR family transcriptional regulator, manganese transport regulator